MKYMIIVGGSPVNARKLTERNHWFWGKQWLMQWSENTFSSVGVFLYENNKCKWMKPSKVFVLTSEANK